MGRDYQLTKKGAQWFSDLGIDTGALRKSGRIFARQCLDWSERRNHLAGALGSALAEHLFERRWIERVRESRVVRITELGGTRTETAARRGVRCAVTGSVHGDLAAASCHEKRLKPSALQSSLPAPWWTKKDPCENRLIGALFYANRYFL